MPSQLARAFPAFQDMGVVEGKREYLNSHPSFDTHPSWISNILFQKSALPNPRHLRPFRVHLPTTIPHPLNAHIPRVRGQRPAIAPNPSRRDRYIIVAPSIFAVPRRRLRWVGRGTARVQQGRSITQTCRA